ncbi:MAG: uroporphyrinogen decarboxylase family protein, partial [Acidimicrobiia bacterium]
SIPAAESVPEVMEAVRLIRKELNGGVPLIGFSGAPFTLASYMIEGRPTRDFAKTKALMFGEPSTWHALMDRLADLVIDYLSEQIDAGIQAVQLFDSWVGALSPQDLDEYVLGYSKRIFESLKGRDVPRIHFGTDTATLLERMASVDCEVVGVDWRIHLDEAWERIGHDKAIQGNLDPGVLLAGPDVVEAKTKDILKRANGRRGHIFNLGHGVLPDSKVDNIKRVIDIVHSYRGE